MKHNLNNISNDIEGFGFSELDYGTGSNPSPPHG